MTPPSGAPDRDAANRWVAMIPRPAARVRLVCFPYAGGGTVAFRSWTRQLPPDVELAAVQLPGREIRMTEPAETRFEHLVDALSDGLTPWVTERPYALFGHSMGALLAFAVARAHRRRGVPPPALLIVSGHDAPAYSSARKPPVPAESDAELLRWMRGLGGTPQQAFDIPDLVDLMLRTVRADLAICDTATFPAEPPLEVPLLAVAGANDPYTCRDGVLAWQHETSAGFTARCFQGGHFFLQTAERELIGVIVERLRAVLPP